MRICLIVLTPAAANSFKSVKFGMLLSHIFEEFQQTLFNQFLLWFHQKIDKSILHLNFSQATMPLQKCNITEFESSCELEFVEIVSNLIHLYSLVKQINNNANKSEKLVSARSMRLILIVFWMLSSFIERWWVDCCLLSMLPALLCCFGWMEAFCCARWWCVHDFCVLWPRQYSDWEKVVDFVYKVVSRCYWLLTWEHLRVIWFVFLWNSCENKRFFCATRDDCDWLRCELLLSFL